MIVHTHAAKNPRSPLSSWDYELGELPPFAVDIAVTHVGICQTDVALVDDCWSTTEYPFVPGRENVGVVTAVGSAVGSGLAVGQRVGIGGICGSCMQCEFCLAGRHHLCPKVVYTAMGSYRGGFANHVRASHWQWVFSIPADIASEHAGPLLGAGATVFTPILRYGISASHRVAVVGIGGLGHLAVQFLSRWGCEVTAISSSHEKDEQSRAFGASHVIATRETDELKSAAGSFDFILNTVSADLPWDQYIVALRPGGTLCVVGIGDGPIAVSPLGLTAGEKQVVGGMPGSIVETEKMLSFASRKGVRPVVETFPMADADRALDHVRKGKARFRAVLVS